MTIHTDTMIWYNLEKYSLDIPYLLKLGVKPNFLNLFEISISKSSRNQANVTKAYKNINPFLEATLKYPSLFDVAGLCEDNNLKEWFEAFVKRSNNIDCIYNYDLMIHDLEIIKYHIDYKETYVIAKRLWNEIFDKIKKKGIRLTENHVYEIYNIGVKAQLNIEIPKSEFFSRELFISTFLDFGNEIMYGTDYGCRKKMKKNDIIDLNLMLYVKTGDQFWTEENEWRKRIEKIGLGDYLFNPNLALKIAESNK